MTTVTINNNTEQSVAPVTYKIGDFFLVGEDGRDALAILCQVGNGDITLVNFNSGNRWFDPTHVEDTDKITRDDLNSLSGYDGDYYDIRHVPSVSISYSL